MKTLFVGLDNQKLSTNLLEMKELTREDKSYYRNALNDCSFSIPQVNITHGINVHNIALTRTAKMKVCSYDEFCKTYKDEIVSIIKTRQDDGETIRGESEGTNAQFTRIVKKSVTFYDDRVKFDYLAGRNREKLLHYIVMYRYKINRLGELKGYYDKSNARISIALPYYGLSCDGVPKLQYRRINIEKLLLVLMAIFKDKMPSDGFRNIHANVLDGTGNVRSAIEMGLKFVDYSPENVEWAYAEENKTHGGYIKTLFHLVGECKKFSAVDRALFEMLDKNAVPKITAKSSKETLEKLNQFKADKTLMFNINKRLW